LRRGTEKIRGGAAKRKSEGRKYIEAYNLYLISPSPKLESKDFGRKKNDKVKDKGSGTEPEKTVMKRRGKNQNSFRANAVLSGAQPIAIVDPTTPEKEEKCTREGQGRTERVRRPGQMQMDFITSRPYSPHAVSTIYLSRDEPFSGKSRRKKKRGSLKGWKEGEGREWGEADH